MELRILMRKQQLYNNQQQAVILSGANPQSIITTLGTLSPNEWVDYTDECSDLHKLELTWTEEEKKELEKSFAPGFKKTSSGTLTFEGNAYRFIRSWLWDDVAAPLNAIEVKIVDTSCGYYEDWSFKNNQIRYCGNGLCEFNITLKQKDQLFDCIQTTLINDNWQGWFQIQPANGKKHPRFSYCNEIRPNGTLNAQWYIMTTLFASMAMPALLMITIINPIILVINAIIAVINALGGNIQPLSYITTGGVTNAWSQYFIESGGCGREHPAPLIRDYITNVCDKCGVQVDAITAPIFFAQTLTVETSDPNRGINGVIQADNPHYNACYLFPRYKRGIRRFRNMKITDFGAPNTTDFWIPDNAPNIALSDFLDQLAGLYNAEWRIRSGRLYFWRKDWFKNGNPVYDFTSNPEDIAKIIDGICYEWSEVTQPAYVDGLYSSDPMDSCGNEALGQMNGKAYSFAMYEDQPNFKGALNKRVEFGAPRFNLDGAQTCYYYDSLQVVANGGIVALLSIGTFFPWIMFTWVAMLQGLGQKFRDFADYALLLRDETTSLPKVIIWDGEEYTNSKALHSKAAFPGVAPQPTPQPNPRYNPASLGWQALHYPQTDVIGKNLTIPPSTPGIYRVEDYFGINITENPAILMNYPMYFEPGFQDTLWDWFHWIDDPRGNPLLNQTFYLKIRYCCEDVKRLGLLNDASENQLGQLIRVPAGDYQKDGKLTEITVSFLVDEVHGMGIEIRGIV